MSEQNELLGRLQDLRELSTSKKYKLTKPEQEEAHRVLSALCMQDENDYKSMIEALSDFPSDVGAAALADSWPRLMEAQRPVSRDLRGATFKSDLGKRLRIILVHRLLENDPAHALRVLLDICQEIKPAKNEIPSAKDLWLIRTALIEPMGQSLGKLPLQQAMTSEVAQLTSYMLAAAFVHKKGQNPLPPQAQLDIIRWANAFPKLGPLPAEVTGAMTQAVNGWNADYRGILGREMDTLQAAFRDVLAPACGLVATPKPTSSITGTMPKEEPPVVSSPPNPASTPAQYDVMYELGRVSKYVQSLETKLKQARDAHQSAEVDWQQALSELGTIRREREDAKRQASIANDSARRLADENRELQKAVGSFCSEVDKLKEQLTASDYQYKEALASHGEKIDIMSERIAREGEHRIDAFRNRLGGKAQTYVDGFMDAAEMEMTAELGTALCGQMRQLLRLLKAEGVRIDGRL